MSYPRQAINEAFALLPTKLDTKEARIEHAAIGFQESRFEARRQIITVVLEGQKVNVPEGPAVSFWQFERGGIQGVMRFHNVRVVEWARAVCQVRRVPFTVDDVWIAMQTDDVLGAAFARLLMYTDAAPLPVVQSEGWEVYLRTWRPGAYKRDPDGLRRKWQSSWAFALEHA